MVGGVGGARERGWWRIDSVFSLSCPGKLEQFSCQGRKKRRH